MSSDGAQINGDHYVKLSGTHDEYQQQHLQRPSDSEHSETECQSRATPWALWPVFITSILAGSAAGPLMKSMEGVGPISMAGWRHQASALVLLPGFIYEMRRMSEEARRKAFSLRNMALHMLSGVALALHFATFIWAIYQTSVPHCVLLVSTSPVFVAILVKVTGGKLQQFELYGVLLGLLGIGILAFGGDSGDINSGASLVGDVFSVFGAFFLAVYFMFGRSLRSSMSLFAYQFPVTVLCVILLGAAGQIFEGSNDDADVGLISGPLGWLRKEYWLKVTFLGAGPGCLGQAGYSYVIKYSSPLVMPTGLSLTSVLSSLLSWLVGQTPMPGVWTWIGGSVTVAGTMLVSIMSHLPPKTETVADPKNGSSSERPSSTVDERNRKTLVRVEENETNNASHGNMV